MYLLYFNIIASIIAIIPIFLIKQYIKYNKFYYLFYSLLSYILLIYIYINIFTLAEVSSSYVILQLMQILIVILISLLLFDEHLTLTKVLGLIFAILSILLLNRVQSS